jgi:site-specific recombinase XerC
MAKVDLKIVQELMGHKTVAMTVRYARLAPTHKLQALEILVHPGSVSVQSGHSFATSSKKPHKAKKVDILQLIESN